MKTYIKYLTLPALLLLIAGLFVSCNDKDDPIIMTGLTLSEETLNVSADGGKYTIVLNAGQDWVVSSDKEWCMVNPANGYGSTICEIHIDSSYLYKERTANLTFRGSNSSRNLTVNQLGYEKVIKLGKKVIEVKDFNEYDKMFEDLKVTSNIKYDIEIEYEDPNRKDWIKVKHEDLKVSSKPLTSTVRINYEMYAESDKDRIATLIFRQREVENGETPVETRLKFLQKKAQEIIPSREGDSLALLAVARIMQCAVNWDTSLPLIHWNNIETEEIEYINHEGKKVDELRVVGLRLTQFNTNKSIPYQIRKLDQLRTLIFTGNYNSAGKDIVLEDDVTYLPKLKALGLLGYGISKLPERMKEMKNLEELELSGNNLTEIPMDIILALDKMKLQYINMSNNRRRDVYGKLYENAERKDTLGLHGEIPAELFTLKNVKYLSLSYNYFEGSIPDMGYDASEYDTEQKKVENNPVMPQIENLSLNLNFLTGRLPDWILYHKHLRCWDPYTLIFNQYEKGKDSFGAKVGFSNEPSFISQPCPLWKEEEEEEELYTRENSFNPNFNYAMEFDAATQRYPILSLQGGWHVNYQPMK